MHANTQDKYVADTFRIKLIHYHLSETWFCVYVQKITVKVHKWVSLLLFCSNNDLYPGVSPLQ